jgi:hypothetical protein
MAENTRPRRKDNDGRHQIHRRPRFAPTTKGIRLVPEQIDWVRQEIEKDPEQSWSRMVREGLFLLRKQREGLIRVIDPSEPPK